jgi:hypothetical protein
MMEMLSVNPYGNANCMEGMKNPPPQGCTFAKPPSVQEGAFFVVFPGTRGLAKYDR